MIASVVKANLVKKEKNEKPVWPSRTKVKVIEYLD